MNRPKSLKTPAQKAGPRAVRRRLSRAAVVGATILGSLAVACSGATTPTPQTPQTMHPHAPARVRVEGSARAEAIGLASKRHMVTFAEHLETTLREPTSQRVRALEPMEFAGMTDPTAATYVEKLVKEASTKDGEELRIVRVVHDGPEPRVVTRKDTNDGRHVFLGCRAGRADGQLSGDGDRAGGGIVDVLDGVRGLRGHALVGAVSVGVAGGDGEGRAHV